jgi:hypothetical protein
LVPGVPGRDRSGAPLASADTTEWNSNANGFFTDPARWTAGVPDAADTAYFGRGNVAYTVTFPGRPFIDPPANYVSDQLWVRINTVTFLQSTRSTSAPRLTPTR